MPAASKLVSYTGARPDVTGLREFTPKRSLDIGCSNGNLSATFGDLGAETWGIEYDPDLATAAKTTLSRVLQGDGLARARELADSGERFDTVVCADVLEHMVDPWSVMTEVRRLISPQGQVLVSLPNVRFYTTIIGLLVQGRWLYADRGVHDRTHLRWFTDRNARDMFSEAGFEVDASIAHYRLFDRPSPRLNRPARFLAHGPLKGLLAYQYVYRLRPR